MLDVRGVSKHYGSIRALSDVALTTAEGEIVAVVGENGAGKSTLVRCIARAVTPDDGSILLDGVELGRTPRDAIDAGISVVWQDLALCENLDVTANLFLGRELGRHGALRMAAMHARTEAVFESLLVSIPELDRPVERLSGGQRQLVAIARATLDQPRVLVLDEPTAALGIAESRTVLGVVKALQARGAAILLISHQLDEVFDIADRIVVMRHGQTVANLHRSETHPDDVVALITGADVDSTAGQQLRRLHSLAEQLSDADQSSVIPLTVSSLSTALSAERLAIFMVEETTDGPILRLSASLNLPQRFADGLGDISVDRVGGFLSVAASEQSLMLVPELGERHGDHVARIAKSEGLVGAWAAPIVGQRGTLAVIAGFTDTIAQLQPDQIQLLELFSTMVGAAIERGSLVETLRVRNQSLEGLRGVLEALAGPALVHSGMSTALDALCTGVTCDAAALYARDADSWTRRATSADASPETLAVLDSSIERKQDQSVMSSTFEWSRGIAVLACCWADSEIPNDSGEVVEGAANSFRLAMERELTMEAERDAAALQRSHETERQLARRLGHELRTPLTAIRGFASTMLQPDVSWPEHEKHRFLAIIERESGRMDRLVAQLFDDTAIESGALRLDFNYCDLVAVLEQAASIAAPPDLITLDIPESFTIWGDQDRLEQVFVNLVANAVRHNAEGTKVRITLEHPLTEGEPSNAVTIRVDDDGAGLPNDALDYLNGDVADRPKDQGLGLRLVRGFVRAHDGTVGAANLDGTNVLIVLPIEPSDR